MLYIYIYFKVNIIYNKVFLLIILFIMLVCNQLFQKTAPPPFPKKPSITLPSHFFPLNQFDLQTKEKVKGVSNSGLKIWGIRIYPFLLVWSSPVDSLIAFFLMVILFFRRVLWWLFSWKNSTWGRSFFFTEKMRVFNLARFTALQPTHRWTLDKK